MIAYWKKYELQFRRPAKTSRDIYSTRTVWYLFLEEHGKVGIGECAPMPGLSPESPQDVEQLLDEICARPEIYPEAPGLTERISSVHFAFETAWLDLHNGGKQQLFDTIFTRGASGIKINGLVWMGDAGFMQQQINEKLKSGFRCIKIKIGGIDFKKEIEILQSIREAYPPGQVMLRLDANGAFSAGEAMDKLHQLARFNIHSIEQPIAAGQWEEMADICRLSPIPVALDEELIGFTSTEEQGKMLSRIKPQFLILKPSLHGGFSGCSKWIEMAKKHSAGWWVTSCLESNIGLNAIAQWAYSKNATAYQGLGTGSLFTNNIPSPLEIRGEELWLNPRKSFHFSEDFLQT